MQEKLHVTEGGLAALCAALALMEASAAAGPTETVLHFFSGGATDGANPAAGLIFDS
jgi:hypothetical protein